MGRGRKEEMTLRKKNLRLYQIWAHMKYRCDTPTHKQYKNYGGRGITYCIEWERYETFYNWAMNNGYEDHLTLDRRNVNGNYEPNNCQWLTQEFQNKNKSSCFFITIDGVTKSPLEWCEVYNLNYNTFYTRYNTYGWDAVKAVITPVTKRKKVVGFNTPINENKSEIEVK